MLSSIIDAVYNVGSAYENRKFWNDYKKRTGFSPRYPYRVGYYKDAYLMGKMFSSRRLKRF